MGRLDVHVAVVATGRTVAGDSVVGSSRRAAAARGV